MHLFLDTLNMFQGNSFSLEEKANLVSDKHFKKGDVSIWVMRQAGRYLPEYRELRKQAGSFLDLCYNPQMAAEVTLQPIRRFGFDAAILFSDILVIPQALGISLEFVAGEGPKLNKIDPFAPKEEIEQRIAALEEALGKSTEFLNPIYETVRLVKEELDQKYPETALIGFCGAPWTVSAYMMDAHPSKGTENTRTLFYKHPELYRRLLEVLIESSVRYLSKQIEAGVDAIQIFDSWAGGCPNEMYEEAVKNPLLEMCKRLKEKHTSVPVILFPRGVSLEKLEGLINACNGNCQGLGLDYTVDMALAVEKLGGKVCLQGNLDPAVLLSTPEKIKQEVQKLLETTKNVPHVFNLGHGIDKRTPIENVQALVDAVREFGKDKEKVV